MKTGLLCCWSRMRIYPIYSSHLRHSLQELTGEEVSIITTDCMCFDKGDAVDQDYEFINIPYVTRGLSNSRVKRYVKAQLYGPIENARGRSFSSRTSDLDVVDFQQSSYAFGYESLRSFLATTSKTKKMVTIHKLDAIQKERPELNRVYNGADGVITFSEYMKQALIADGVMPEKISVIYHGTSLYPVRETRREQAILFCGSPIPKIKGFEDYVVTLRMLRDEGIDLRTKVYGFFMKEEKEYSLRLAAQQGVEDLLEWQSFKDEAELTEEYQKSRLCVIPYTGYAGYFPAAYAMGNGVPVVATDILGHSEYVGDAGLLVPPGSPEDLAGAIKRVLNDDALRTLLGANGRRRAEETLSWGTVASQTLEFFNEVMGVKGERAAS